MVASTDVAVVGAGIIGLSTAYTLQQRGVSVTVYEQGRPGGGQSAGQSRLFRHAHADPRMIELAITARAMWAGWEREFGVELVDPDGAVALGPAVEAKFAALQQFPALGARMIDGSELAARLSVLAGYDGPVLFDPGAGAIRTGAAIAALGARLSGSLVTEHVLALHDVGGGVDVHSATGCARFGRVLVCAGRGTAALAGTVGVSVPAAVSAHVRVAFRVRGDAPATLAVLQDGGGFLAGTSSYASAYPDRRTYAVGIGDSVPIAADGVGLDAGAVAALAARTARYVAVALPGLDPTPADFVHCWVTELPWGEDGIAIWEAGGGHVIAGNNMFKHAPALATVLADCVTGATVPDRFTAPAELGAGNGGG